MVGASWSLQFVAATASFGFGAVAAFATLLFGLKLRGAEKFLADFLAVVALTGIFIASVHFGAQGQPTFYGAACYVLGIFAGRKLIVLCKRILPERKKKGSPQDAENRKQ